MMGLCWYPNSSFTFFTSSSNVASFGSEKFTSSPLYELYSGSAVAVAVAGEEEEEEEEEEEAATPPPGG